MNVVDREQTGAAVAAVATVPGPASPTAVDAPSWAYRGYRVGEVLVRVLPRVATYVLAAAVASVAVRLRPARFAALRSNLCHVMPNAGGRDVERVLRRNVANVIRCWFDVMEMRYHPKRIARRLHSVHGIAHYDEALARGRGVVVVSIHHGNWETGLAAWNLRGGELALLAEEVRPARLFNRIVAARRTMGVKVIPINAAGMRGADATTGRQIGASAMREVLKHLKAGNTIAIAIDRDITGRGEMLPFFGAPAPIPVGTVDVAIRAGAAIVPVVLRRRGHRVEGVVYPEVRYDAEAPHHAEAVRITTALLATFEGVIGRHPEMWHVLEPIWPESSRR